MTTSEETKNSAETASESAPQKDNPCLRRVSIEVPAATVAAEFDRVLQQYQKLARIPGFRKGKVPASILKQRFAGDIRQEVLEHIVPRHFRQEVERQNLRPISQPNVTDLHLHDNEPLKFTAEFEVLPEIEVQGYQDLKLDRPDTTITEDEVEQALQHLQQQHATYAAVDEQREIREGDFAQVSFTGVPKAEAAAEGEGEPPAGEKPVEVDDVLVEVGGPNTVQEFTDNLSGAKPGDSRTFDVQYAEDFSDKRLAGKTMTYTLNVKGIKSKNVPALDDEFAKQLGEQFESLDALRGHLRERMQLEKAHTAEHSVKDKLIERLVQQNEFPVPEALVERQIDVRLERGLRALAQQGMRTEDMRRLDFDRLRSGQREAARREVKASLILDKIADAEQINVSDEDVNREVEALASQMQQSKDEVLARLTREGALDRIRDRIRNDKTLEFLYDRSA